MAMLKSVVDNAKKYDSNAKFYDEAWMAEKDSETMSEKFEKIQPLCGLSAPLQG